MIRAVLVVGWVGLLLLLATGVTGYQVASEEAAQHHLTLSLFPTGALLFADLCVVVYLLGTLLLVRRTAAALALPADWAAEQRRLMRAAAVWPAAGALALATLFGSGFPVYASAWPAWVHHSAFFFVAVLHLLFLLRGGKALREGERRLAAFAAAVEAAGGR